MRTSGQSNPSGSEQRLRKETHAIKVAEVCQKYTGSEWRRSLIDQLK